MMECVCHLLGAQEEPPMQEDAQAIPLVQLSNADRVPNTPEVPNEIESSKTSLHDALEKSEEKLGELLAGLESLSWFKRYSLSQQRLEEINKKVGDASRLIADGLDGSTKFCQEFIFCLEIGIKVFSVFHIVS